MYACQTAKVLVVTNPVIVVEVLSPGTKHIDKAAKLLGYFSIATVQHYLIVDTEKEMIIHHARASGDLIETRICG
ncbi:MAG: Uma2 family endonuclease [Hyphomicrobiales bacterium]|nr:Uma2 family endonuclease [Hyphomicrobiales bacterium]